MRDPTRTGTVLAPEQRKHGRARHTLDALELAGTNGRRVGGVEREDGAQRCESREGRTRDRTERVRHLKVGTSTAALRGRNETPSTLTSQMRGWIGTTQDDVRSWFCWVPRAMICGSSFAPGRRVRTPAPERGRTYGGPEQSRGTFGHETVR